MSVDIKFVVALMTITGTALIGIFAYFYKAHDERKKSARKTLYYLLEIRHSIITSLFDPKEEVNRFLNVLIERFNKRGLKMQKEELPSEVAETLLLTITRSITCLREDLAKELIKPYEEQLLLLAADKPLLAFYLKGKHKLEDMMKIIESHLASINSIVEMPDELNSWMKDYLTNLPNNTLQKVKSDVLNELESDIILLAKECGFFTSRKVKKIISHKLSLDNSVTLEEIEAYIDFVVEGIVAAHEEAKQQPKEE
ncbi:hypothetical protein MHM98_15465 [Psychrobium sp. MM17-31]|uniref:hypothetical protein n=1 Tax=Psychrobium sp. MM17-31 TaxID=2917758 RepID=UPI001EF6AF9D|nr:hypothetical protein [Psychrobium sp. MM17-31]MCG7532732.1 hypothetical protein [Psychrobium sp. MM17-31]